MWAKAARVAIVAVALGGLFIVPFWSEASNAVLPVWWPESGWAREIQPQGLLVDGLAIVAILAAIFTWPIRRSSQ
jgi:hypothetical protein